jgi:hypothetical protein
MIFGAAWLLLRTGWISSSDARASAQSGRVVFYSACKLAFTALTPPLARVFWNRLSVGAVALAERARMLYIGDGQTYLLYILYYFIVLCAVSGGFDHKWLAVWTGLRNMR